MATVERSEKDQNYELQFPQADYFYHLTVLILLFFEKSSAGVPCKHIYVCCEYISALFLAFENLDVSAFWVERRSIFKARILIL